MTKLIQLTPKDAVDLERIIRVQEITAYPAPFQSEPCLELLMATGAEKTATVLIRNASLKTLFDAIEKENKNHVSS